MTTPILEPLLAVTAAAPVSAQRDAPADDRAFRDLLTPPAKRPDDAPRAESRASSDEVPQPPVCSTPPPSDDVSATEEQDEPEESDSRDATAIAAVVVISAPAVIVEAEPNAETEVLAEAVAALEGTESDSQTETPTEAVELPSEALPANETANVAAAQVDFVEAVDDVETPKATPLVVDQNETPAATSLETEVAITTGDAPVENVELATAEANAVPEEHHSTQHAALAQLESQRQEPSSPFDRQATLSNDDDAAKTTIAAGQAAEPIASPKRAAGKARESEKRETKGVGDAAAKNVPDAPQETVASNVAEKQGPTALTTSAIADAAAEAKPPAAVDGTATRADASGAHSAPATAERLGTMLAQRRVKMSATGHGPALTESQQARLVQRVARAFDTARMRGDAEIRLRLSPPELGALKLEVRMESGVMTARLEVETVAAQQALSDNLGTLRQRLAEQNIRVEQFDVDLMDRHNGNPSDSPTSQSNHDERQTQRSGTRSPQTQRTGPTSAVAVEPRAAMRASGGLDVLI